jgi:hypothetical protein
MKITFMKYRIRGGASIRCNSGLIQRLTPVILWYRPELEAKMTGYPMLGQ